MIFYGKKFSKGILIVLLTALFVTALAFFAIKPSSARADENNKVNVFLPFKSEEYYALSSPIHAYSDGEISAVITNNKKIILSKNGSISEITFANEDELGGQIARFGNYLIYRKSQKLYGVKINDTESRTELKFINSNNEQDTVNCNSHFYYANGATRMLAACVENKLRLFTVSAENDGKPVLSPVPYFINNPLTIADKSPLALNASSVFYLDDSDRLCKINLSSLHTYERYSTDIIPTTSMVANDEFLYFISGTKIYRLAINNIDAVPQQLTFSEESYNLGTVNNPKGLSFKDGNLLVTNFAENGSVQEFKINGDTLEFTGYAIASGLSAFNRVAKNAFDIERYGKYVAVLDNYKLTVIDTESYLDETDSHAYNKAAFINKLINNDTKLFALGNGTVMVSNDISLSLGTINGDETTQINTEYSNVLDISYQSGKYYLVYTNGTDSFVVTAKENDGSVTDTLLFTDAYAKIIASTVTADVFGNVYIADGTKIYKNNSDESFEFTNAKKLCTDLAGNLFVLGSDGKIYKLDEETKTFTVVFETALGKIKTFGLNFDRDELFFLLDGKEEIYYTTAAGNTSLENVKPNADFEGATIHKNALALYTAKDGANVYSVEKDGEDFKFKGLAKKSDEYPLIAKIVISDNLTMYALAVENGVALINEKDLSEKAISPINAPLKAYVTTAVYGYAIPVIEQQNAFIINDGEKTARINKGTVIEIEKGFTVLGKTYYDAKVTINGETLDCYIPADFTATVLAETLEFTDYTIERVKQTAVYVNAELTEELFALKDGDSVKLLATENGVLKVIATDENGVEVVGYIAENSLAENPNTTVRNILIVLAVFASLAGTVSFFLLRKKTI